MLLRERFGESRVACVGGPAHAREMVSEGAALVAASTNEELANTIAGVFIRAGVVCERSNDPIGVELAGAAKNAAGLAAGATEAQGLNAAGAAAGHIFAEVWRYSEAQGARPESMLGLAGTGDLVATVLAPQSRNRRAGELLAAGVPAAEIPERIGQAVEALDTVPLLARALRNAGLEATVTDGLAQLISGELPLEDWIALVRTTVPPPARWRRRPPPGFWAGLSASCAASALGQSRDDRVVDARPVGPLGDPHVRARAVASCSVGSRCTALATNQNVPTLAAVSMSSRESPTAMTSCGVKPRARMCSATALAFDAPRGTRWYARTSSSATRSGDRRCTPPLSTSRRPPWPCSASSASTSDASTSPRKRCETSRPRCHGSWYSSRPA